MEEDIQYELGDIEFIDKPRVVDYHRYIFSFTGLGRDKHDKNKYVKIDIRYGGMINDISDFHPFNINWDELLAGPTLSISIEAL